MLQVPYKGIPLAVTDVLGGNLRAIGVSSARRSALAPDWPALAETLPGFDIDAWLATLGPKGLSEQIARRLHEATVRAMAKPDVQSRLATLGFTPALIGPADAAPFVKAEVAKWAALVKQAGILPE